MRDLKVFFSYLGADEHLKAPTKPWPDMTFDGWAVSRATTDRNAVLATLKHRLQSSPPVLPSAAVRQALAAVPEASAFLRACAYLDALAANAPPPVIASPAAALSDMHAADLYLAWGLKPRNVPELESRGITFADKHIAEYVAAHRCVGVFVSLSLFGE